MTMHIGSLRAFCCMAQGRIVWMGCLVTMLGCLLSSSCLLGQSSSADNTDKVSEEPVKLSAESDGSPDEANLEEEIRAYTNAVERDKNDVDSWGLLAMAYARANRSDKAMETFNKALEENPRSWRLYVGRGEALVYSRNFAKAAEDAARAIRLAPNEAQPYSLSSWCHVNLGQFDEALKDINVCIRLQPGEVSARLSRGYILKRLNQREAALADFTVVIDESPEILPAFRERAETYLDLGKAEKAIPDLNRYLQARPDDYRALYVRGYARYLTGDLNGAQDDLERSIRQDADDQATMYATHNILAEIRLRQNQPQEALALTERAAKISPDRPRSFGLRAKAFVALGEVDAAQQELDAMPQHGSADAELLLVRAEIYRARKMYPETLEALNQFLKVSPQNIHGYRLRGLTHAQLANPQSALDDFNTVIRLGQPQAIDYIGRARLLTKAKRLEEALLDANLAIELDDDQALFYAQRAEIKRLLGDLTYWDDLSKHVELAPDDPFSKQIAAALKRHEAAVQDEVSLKIEALLLQAGQLMREADTTFLPPLRIYIEDSYEVGAAASREQHRARILDSINSSRIAAGKLLHEAEELANQHLAANDPRRATIAELRTKLEADMKAPEFIPSNVLP